MGTKSQSSDKPVVVKRGSVIVKIYSGLTRGYKTFTLSYYEGGKRVRRTFASLAEAKSEAEIVATRLDNADARALELTGADREQYLLATNELEEIGIPLHLAIREFVAARKISGDVSLVDTARLHQSRTDPNRPKKTVKELTRECLAGKAADGLSHRYLVQLRSDLNRFSHDFEKQISDVEGSEIDDWLRGLRHDGKPVSGRTRNNLRTSNTTLFSYARQRGYLPPDVSTAAESVPRAKVVESDIEILTPGQMEKLLRNAEGDALLHIVLAGFAGLRTAEISRLTWDNIDLTGGHIVVPAAKAKTASRRLTPIPANLKAWLLPLKASGSVLQTNEVFREVTALASSLGITWSQNVLRHSAISYRLAVDRDVARVSLDAGTSAGVVFKHYRQLATKAQGAKWFRIRRKGKS